VVTVDLTPFRDRFPALARCVDERPCVFADAPGGTQVPEEVIEAMADYLRRSNANVGGPFVTSEETVEVIAGARRAAADLLGCGVAEVVFGPNTTSLVFSISRAIARDLGPEDEIVVTHLDHDANIAPWLAVAEDTGATIRWADIDPRDCSIDPDGFRALLGERTRVVAFTLASNAVGTVTAADDLIAAVRERAPGAIVAVDAVHLAPHQPIDVRTLGADLLFCSAYKFFGPHLGIAYGRPELLARLRPYKVRPAGDAVPGRWETGTQNHEALAGLVATVNYLGTLGWVGPDGVRTGRAGVVAGLSAVQEYETRLTVRFLERVVDVPGAKVYGIADPARASDRTPTFAVRLGELPPRRVAEALGRRGIFVWDGNYYALALMERLGLEASGGAVRIGFCHYNTMDEVDVVLAELAAIAKAS
jgi:cysteine desulfurase family protein (TIGR01976 family)